ncbi:basic amino acid ABC transporter substrate-binding protein [Methanohalophilus sp.]|uniref:basic amino acid ABC transporter substrate-binding protein n=1 Tax=Methanohalophilus sp. TaxID=1966352 RepID=UPI0026331F79|nr:basic amino acid ABC transporter substrate-binding protein [Methanohalophilus sp.]MDK2892000.1 glutamine transport system substrate-binding protein [Methanohalophilus sp.]
MTNNFLKITMLALVIFAIAASGCTGDQTGDTIEETEEIPLYYVGTEPTFPPFEYTDETGEIIGFDIDLIKAIAADQGFEVEIQPIGFDALIPALQGGNIDIAASGMTITEEREKEVDFSAPYINAGLALAVAADNDEILGVDDLQGKIAAVQVGTTGSMKAHELLDAGILSEVKEFSTVDVVMMELISGGADVVINDLPVTEAYIKQQPGKIKIVDDKLTSESYGFAVKEGNKELLDMINTGLQNVIADGTYDELLAKYFG